MKQIVALIFTLFFLASCQQEPSKNSDKYLVGVEYFAGWWEESPNKWHQNDGTDWRHLYPERIPLHGQYNSQEVMDRDIEVASLHGVDFFSILWYYDNGKEPHVDKINQAVDWFTSSPNADKMKFMIEVINHPPFAMESQEQWDTFTQLCISKMNHPSYLRIDGRPVIKIFDSELLVTDLGGNPDQGKSVIEKMRKDFYNAGYPDVIIAGGVWETHTLRGSLAENIGFDCTMQYMDPTSLPQKETPYSYDSLAITAHRDRMARIDDCVPHIPFVPVNWDPRPWFDPRASFDSATQSQWQSVLEQVREDLDSQPNFGFPRRDGTLQKAFTIYAWNEYGEGGILAPTAGDGKMRLETLSRIFPNEN